MDAEVEIQNAKLLPVPVAVVETVRDGTLSNCSPCDEARGILYKERGEEADGSTQFAVQHIRKDSVVSAFRLLCDEIMMRHIQHCTEVEIRNRLVDESWSMSWISWMLL